MLLAPTILTLASLTAPQSERGDAARAIRDWAQRYERGAIELTETTHPGATATALYRGIVDKQRFGQITHFDALRVVLDHAIEQQSPDIVRAGLELATVGQRRADVRGLRRPDVVRNAAISTLGQFTQSHPLHTLMRIADGDATAWPADSSPVIQAAAIRALGAVALPVARPLLERHIAHEHADVRLAAAAALHATGPPRSLDRVCAALDAERDPLVAELLAQTAHAILRRNIDRCDTRLVRRAVLAAVALVGRLDWRVDLAAVDLLGDFRNVAAIEPLVRTLERFRVEPDAIERGELSGVLRHRAHEVLESLTGARIPAHEASRWREFWERERDGFVLAQQPDADARTSSGFFGIPIVGTRVVFVIDRSGSMNQKVVNERGDAPPGRDPVTRFEFARRELMRAVNSLPADTRFNVVTFNEKVNVWRRKFADPTSKNISTLRQKLRNARVLGGTNVYGALDATLGLRASKSGQRYPTPVDEVFLLSDGAPTVGDIVAPAAILEVVGEANARRRVRINTVFIGAESASEFMRSLATQNDGQFVRL